MSCFIKNDLTMQKSGGENQRAKTVYAASQKKSALGIMSADYCKQSFPFSVSFNYLSLITISYKQFLY